MKLKNNIATVISAEKMQELLDWTYDKAVQGLPGITFGTKFATSYIQKM